MQFPFVHFEFKLISSSVFPIKVVGKRGKRTQSTMHSYHDGTGVIFFAEINKNAVSCWNVKAKLKASNMGLIAKDDETLVYPNDLSVSWSFAASIFRLKSAFQVVDDELWVMSNRMIRHIYTKLKSDDYNFRIFRQNVKEAVKNTRCAESKLKREIQKSERD